MCALALADLDRDVQFELEELDVVRASADLALLRVSGRWRAERSVQLEQPRVVLAVGATRHVLELVPGSDPHPLATIAGCPWKAGYRAPLPLLASPHATCTLEWHAAVFVLPISAHFDGSADASSRYAAEIQGLRERLREVTAELDELKRHLRRSAAQVSPVSPVNDHVQGRIGPFDDPPREPPRGPPGHHEREPGDGDAELSVFVEELTRRLAEDEVTPGTQTYERARLERYLKRVEQQLDDADSRNGTLYG
jgi:hypothetical protein